VVAALAKLSGENEEAQREIERLGAEIDALKIAVGERLEHDNQLERALAAASKRADEILVRAEEEARQMRREAEEQGELIIERLRDQPALWKARSIRCSLAGVSRDVDRRVDQEGVRRSRARPATGDGPAAGRRLAQTDEAAVYRDFDPDSREARPFETVLRLVGFVDDITGRR
jgi:cell division septum initiation protein DivIVA